MKYFITFSIAILLSSCIRPIMWRTSNGWEPIKPGIYIIIAAPKR